MASSGSRVSGPGIWQRLRNCGRGVDFGVSGADVRADLGLAIRRWSGKKLVEDVVPAIRKILPTCLSDLRAGIKRSILRGEVCFEKTIGRVGSTGLCSDGWLGSDGL